MIKGRTLAILGGLTLLAVGASVYMEKQDTSRSSGLEQQGQLLLPDLKQRLNDVAEVQLRSADQTTTLTHRDTNWLIAERNNFPADVGKVRALLLGAASLTIVEPKTSNAELFSQLGLEDLGVAGAQSTWITFKDAQANVLAAVVFGKDRPSKGSLDRSEHYVRRPDVQQAWLVEGRVHLDKRPQDWMSKTLTNLENSRIKQVSVEHADTKEVLRLAKESGEALDFQIAEPKTNKPVKAAFEINTVANTFAHLSFEDVKPLSEVDFTKEPVYVATLETFDGLTLTLRTARVGEQTFGRLQAQGVPAPAAAPAQTVQAESAPPSETAPQTQTDTSAAPQPKTQPIDVTKEAADLTARFADWAFQLPAHQVENIGKKLTDLLEEPAAAENPPEN